MGKEAEKEKKGKEKKACDTEMRRRQSSYSQPAITIIFPPPFVPCQTQATRIGTDNLKVHARFEIQTQRENYHW